MTDVLVETNQICQLCLQGNVTTHMENTSYTYMGHTGDVPSYFLVCDTCGSDFCDYVHFKMNRDAVLNFQNFCVLDAKIS